MGVLRKPMTVSVQGVPTTVNQAWRVVVTGGPFPVLDVAPSVWIDTTRIGDALENEDLSELQAIVFDPSLMRNGAVIGISMGACGEGRTDLPETMQLQATP